jgi:hypothetical protein
MSLLVDTAKSPTFGARAPWWLVAIRRSFVARHEAPARGRRARKTLTSMNFDSRPEGRD